MKQSRLWLLALLTVLTFVAATTAMAEEGAGHVTGSWELGMSGINTDDNAARVNEFGSVRAEDGVSIAPQLDLEFENGGFVLEIESETMGPRDQMHEISIDAGRVFKLESELNVLEHHLDHDNLEHLGATMAGDVDGDQPRVFTNATKDPIQYAWELDQDYIITRREWKSEAELTLPQLPNVTFKAGVRMETREGLEQAIAISKCSACHVEANPKSIDEQTEEYTLGATGKFGLLTVEYEYLTRDFQENSGVPTYDYWNSSKWRIGSQDPDQLLYINENLEYNQTPDSEKESHMVKARIDLPNNTVITGTYVKADIDSSKDDEPGTYEFVGNDTLTSQYESFALKGATRIGNLRLSIRGSQYEIDGPEYTLYFEDRVDNVDFDHDGTAELSNNNFDTVQDYESAETRDVTEFGFDAVYRVARGTTVRLGYEYEDLEREAHEGELGETETHTFKAAVNTRISRQLNARFSYKYLDIDDPFGADHATGIAQGHPDATYDGDLAYLPTADYINNPQGTNPDELAEGNTAAVYYWNTIYPARGLSATSEPDEVHEGKFSTTWTPAANMALTAYARVRYEENDEVKYEETTYVPGASFWYAPTSKMNLTMAYNFNRQETDNQMCIGWYHG